MKTIPGYPRYSATEDGRIWSHIGKGRFLKPTHNNRGYGYIALSNRKRQYVHRLIAMTYLENPDNLATVDHINRDQSDNRLENLRWSSYSDQNINRHYENPSGHRLIIWDKSRGKWKCQTKRFTTKTDCICYKFVFLLKQKAGLTCN